MIDFEHSAMKHMLLWANFRRFYLYVMTENMKRVLMAHQQSVLNEEVKSRYQLCERAIFSAATIPEFDEAYTRYANKFENHSDRNESMSFQEDQRLRHHRGALPGLQLFLRHGQHFCPHDIYQRFRRPYHPRIATLLAGELCK